MKLSGTSYAPGAGVSCKQINYKWYDVLMWNENACMSNRPRVDGDGPCKCYLWPWSLTLTFDLGDLDLWPPFLIVDWKTHFSILYFDFWPTTLTFNPILARVTINIHAKSPVHSLNSLAMRVHTDRQTNKHTQETYNIASSANAGGKTGLTELKNPYGWLYIYTSMYGRFICKREGVLMTKKT